MSLYNTGDHKCDMLKTSVSGLPTISPKAGVFTKISRFISKVRLPTYYHPGAVQLYKSEKSLIEERRRLISEAPWYVIHPFSVFSVLRDFIMFHTYFADVIVSNILNSFGPTPGTLRMFAFIGVVDNTCSVIYCINVIACAITGYKVEDSQEIELRPRRLVVRYLKSYALLDCILIMPMSIFFKDTDAAIVAKATFVAYCVRAKALLPHFRMTLNKFYGVPKAYIKISISVLLIILLQHFCTCLSASLWRTVPKTVHDNRNVTSLYEIFVNGNFTWMEQYISHYHIIICHFYYAGKGRHSILTTEECVFYVLIMTFSFFIGMYFLSIVYALVKQKTRSQIRFHVVLEQFNDFANRKGISSRLKYRIMTYLNQKYHGNVFNEQVFKAGLSEHLQLEVKLHACVHLLHTVPLFNGLSKSALGQLVSILETTSFIPGEIIHNVNEQINNLYIISRGTVAAYTDHGVEVAHFQDGDVLGILAYFAGHHEYTIVTVEYTEAFYISNNELTKILEKMPEVGQRMLIIAQSRQGKFNKYLNKISRQYRATINIEEVLEKRQLRHVPG